MEYQSENFNGNFDFRSRIHDNWVMGKHLHEYSELLYCRKGWAKVFVNGRCLQLPEKHFVWIPPNYIHQYECADAKVICAVFSNDYIPLFFRMTGGKRLKVSAVKADRLENIFEHFHTISKENFLLISGYLNLICSKVVERAEFDDAKHSDGILYQKVISYISAHFNESISLKSIAKEFGYNEKYLSHLLHELTGIHFSKLLALYRIEYAKKVLLSEKTVSIAEVALRSGFSAINTFNREFKEFTLMTPSNYRKVHTY